MKSESHDPYQLARLLDRRQFLGVSAVGVAGLALPSYATARDRRGLLEPKREARRLRSGAVSHPPNGLGVTSSLSEDHFLIRTAKIDPAKDTVVAYSRLDGHAEALVLQNGVISQAFRDPTSASGWGMREVASGATEMVGAMINNTVTQKLQLHVFYRTSDGQLHHLLEDPPVDGISSGSFTLVGSADWGNAGALQLTTNADQELLAFAVAPSSVLGHPDAKLYYRYVPREYGGRDDVNGLFSGVVTGFAYYGNAGHEASAIVASGSLPGSTMLIYVPPVTLDQGQIAVHRFAVPRAGDVRGTVSPLAGVPFRPPFTVKAVAPPSFSFSVKSIEYVYEAAVFGVPVAVVRSTDDELFTLSAKADATQWFIQKLIVPTGERGSGAPLGRIQPSLQTIGSGHSLAGLFVVIDGTLSVMRQVDQDAVLDYQQPIFYPPISLQGGIAAVSSQTRVSSGDELITVGEDGDLQMLARAQDGGWVTTDIHLPADETAQLSTYRVQLSLTDDWGSPVAGELLKVSSSSPAIVLVDGLGVSLSDVPVMLSTDATGQLTIPILANGLYAPKLTVEGGGLTSPVTVSPSEPVNTYMQGTAPLGYMPVVDGSGLAGANTADGGAVFPEARKSDDVAQQAAAVLASVATAGAHPATGPGVGQRETVALGTSARQLRAISVNGVQLSFDKLFHDAVYGIKTGAAKVKQVLVSWDEDAKQWVSQVTADFAAWADQAINIVIKGLEDAAHALHSVINKLAAVLVEVVKWLEVHILKLLADAVTLADRYDGWLLDLADTITNLLLKSKSGSDQWLERQRDAIHRDLESLKKLLGSRSIESLGDASTLASRRTLGGGDGPAPDQTHSNSHWLLQKVTQDNPAKPPPIDLAQSVRTLLSDLEQNIAEEGKDLKDAFNAFRDALQDFVSNPKNFGQAGIDRLIDAFGAIVDTALTFAKLVIDVLLDLLTVAVALFKQVIATPLNQLPLVGPLLRAAGMTKPLTIGAIVSLLVAFPTVLTYKIAHLSFDAVPFRGASLSTRRGHGHGRHHRHAERPLLAASSIADDLDFTTGGVKVFDGFVSLFPAAFIAAGAEPPAFLRWIEIVCPALIGVLTVPAHAEDLPFASPIKLDDNSDVLNAAFWVSGVLPGVFGAVAYAIGEKDGEEAGQAAAESTLYLTSLDGGLGVIAGVVGALASNIEDPAKGALVAGAAVLDRVAPTLDWGLAHSLVSATEGLSAVLASLIGGVCTIVAGTMAGEGIR